jgi:tRNA threonylcarbamoyladenosine biosynthesis protein TsaE
LPIVETTAEMTFALRTELATQVWAQALAQVLTNDAALQNGFIALHGELGAGKTTLVRHLLHALGVAGRIKSPTYAVLESYQIGDWPIWHFDFYRFADPQEWEGAGFRDIFAGPGLKLAEWPDKAGDLLPVADVSLHLSLQTDDSRALQLHGQTALGQRLLKGLNA